jgi:hypothetical protein
MSGMRIAFGRSVDVDDEGDLLVAVRTGLKHNRKIISGAVLTGSPLARMDMAPSPPAPTVRVRSIYQPAKLD